MWGRVVQVMLGWWLVLSPFIFNSFPDTPAVWINDWVCGAVVIVTSLLSWWPLTRYAYLTSLAVSTWLVGYAYFRGGYPSAPGFQNQILVGLTLLLFAIIPNDASQPPPRWRAFYRELALREDRTR